MQCPNHRRNNIRSVVFKNICAADGSFNIRHWTQKLRWDNRSKFTVNILKQIPIAYRAIIKPVWSYDVKLWRTLQNKVLRRDPARTKRRSPDIRLQITPIRRSRINCSLSVLSFLHVYADTVIRWKRLVHSNNLYGRCSTIASARRWARANQKLEKVIAQIIYKEKKITSEPVSVEASREACRNGTQPDAIKFGTIT